VDNYAIKYSPEFLKAAHDAAELDEERTKLQTVLEPETFERVRQIVEAQDRRKRAAYYGTILEAARAGEDFAVADFGNRAVAVHRDIKGICPPADLVNAVGFGDCADLTVKAAGHKRNKDFIGLFGRDLHIGPNGIHRIRVKVILRGQFLRFRSVEVNQHAATPGKRQREDRREDKG